MTGAMYASIAGLKTHMQKLNVIGNNVANLNTNGYKTKRTVFQDAVYTQYRSGSDGTNSMAGINPSQIGYGVRISTIDISMTTGSYNPGNPTDCMLDGDGFFLVGRKEVADTLASDPTNPNLYKSLTLTRVGNFEFKEDGYFANNDGNAVYGFMVVGTDAEGKPIVSDQLVPIRLPEYEMIETKVGTGDDAPTEVQYTLRWPVVATTTGDNNNQGGNQGGNQGANNTLVEDPTATTTADGLPKNLGLLNVTDQRRLQNYSEYIEEQNQNDNNNNNNQQGDEETKREFGIVKMESISVSTNGAITGIVSATKEQITIGYIAVGNPTNPNGLTHAGGHYYTCGDGAGDLSIATIGGVGEELQIAGGSKVGGNGYLEYVNGSLLGLEDDEKLSERMSSLCALGGTGKTTLISGFLEGSNADLATEISELITTQRGYQANTRIVTVTDSMLEELVNMKR